MFFPTLFVRRLGPALASVPRGVQSNGFGTKLEIAGAHDDFPEELEALMAVLTWDIDVAYTGGDAPAWSKTLTAVPAGVRRFVNYSASVDTTTNSPGWENPDHVFEARDHDAADGYGPPVPLDVFLTEVVDDGGIFYTYEAYLKLGVSYGFISSDPAQPCWVLWANLGTDYLVYSEHTAAVIQTIPGEPTAHTLISSAQSMQVFGLPTEVASGDLTIGTPAAGWTVKATANGLVTLV